MPAMLQRTSDLDLVSRLVLANMSPPNSTELNKPDPSILPYTQGLDGVSLTLDHVLLKWLWIMITLFTVLLLLCRIYQLITRHVRHIYSMAVHAKQQNYWSYDESTLWPFIKRQLLYAPLGSKRHNKEIQLSRAVNVGTLPSRFHALLLCTYVGINIAYCCILDYKAPNKASLIAEIRGRTGLLATANMIPLILLAGRNNPAIALLRVSFDSFNLFHRWIGRIIILEAVAHTIAWGANSVEAKGMRATLDCINGNIFLQYGLTGIIAMVLILIQSPSPVRHAFYETFLHLHQALAFVAILAIYVHLEVANLPALPYIRVVVGLWAIERFTRSFRLFYLNLSRTHGSTRVVVEALPGEATRVTFHLPRHITVRPGSHVYAYLPRISWWMSHPFSVAWTNIESEPPTGLRQIELGSSQSDEDPSLAKEDCLDFSKAPTSVSLIMVARTGMTRKLYNKAMASTNRVLQMSGYLEGPYAGHDSLASYGTVILFAGGAGITHHLVQIRHLIASAKANTVATRKIILVWSVRNVEMLAWVRPWMDEILQTPGRREVLRMMLYVTKPRDGTDLVSPSARVKLYPGRCDANRVLEDVLPDRVGVTAVSVCGPGAFADDVRAAVRAKMHWGSIDFMEEAFTW